MKYFIIVVLVLSVLLVTLRVVIDERQQELDVPAEILKVSKMTGEMESENHFYVITKGGDLKLFVSRSNKSRGDHTLQSVSASGSIGWKVEYYRYSRKPGHGLNDNIPASRYSAAEAIAMFTEVLKLPLPEDEISKMH